VLVALIDAICLAEMLLVATTLSDEVDSPEVAICELSLGVFGISTGHNPNLRLTVSQ